MNIRAWKPSSYITEGMMQCISRSWSNNITSIFVYPLSHYEYIKHTSATAKGKTRAWAHRPSTTKSNQDEHSLWSPNTSASNPDQTKIFV